MKISIITPSFNQLGYLKRCVASVADQVAPEAQRSEIGDQRSVNLSSDLCRLTSGSASQIHVHHHVQDGGSTDGTVEWLERYAQEIGGRRSEDSSRPKASGLMPNAYSFSFFSEKDEGMYDALNKGFDRASGDIFAWLNCDEQYLEDTLVTVARKWEENPSLDLLSGSLLLIRPEGTLLARRQALPLRADWIEAAHLYNLSGGLFFRRSVWKRNIRFDTSYKNLGDEEWVLRLLTSGVCAACIKEPLTAFCFTGANLSRQPGAEEEKRRLRRQHAASLPAKIYRNGCRRLEKLRSGAYNRPALDYAVYTSQNLNTRTFFHVEKAPFRWPRD